MILGGDVGGTKSNLGLFEVVEGGRLHLIRTATFANAEYPGLGVLLGAFLGGDVPRVRAAAFGIAGPVLDNRAETTNLTWVIDGPGLAKETGIPRVLLINDLVATAEGIPLLGEDEVVTLQPGAAGAHGNRVLIAAGTGLGMSLLPWVDGRWVPVASEGGHADFAPRDADEEGLLRHLQARLGGRVSVERVVSGPGLFNIYEYLRDDAGMPELPEVRAALAAGDDPVPVISESGLTQRCGLCSRALDLFMAAYGAAAGNLALVGTATGGVYVGGGIAPKVLPRIQEGGFLQAFVDKGRFEGYVRAIPVRVILNQKTAMYGAARVASLLRVG
ncbi:MAG TPA: glucokinase [Thermoanaerobaculia bacterium]|nr:glucokinase [Thermoanaerobaculia bacterium]